MGYKILLTESAEKDLDKIVGYIVEKLCNPTAAVELLSAIDAAYARLEETPFLYAQCQHKLLSRCSYRKAFIRGYLLIYRVDEEQRTVYIEHAGTHRKTGDFAHWTEGDRVVGCIFMVV